MMVFLLTDTKDETVADLEFWQDEDNQMRIVVNIGVRGFANLIMRTLWMNEQIIADFEGISRLPRWLNEQEEYDTEHYEYEYVLERIRTRFYQVAKLYNLNYTED